MPHLIPLCETNPIETLVSAPRPVRRRVRAEMPTVQAAARYALHFSRRALPAERDAAFTDASERFWAHLDATGVRLSPPSGHRHTNA